MLVRTLYPHIPLLFHIFTTNNSIIYALAHSFHTFIHFSATSSLSSSIAGWRHLGIAMISVATAMLCKEQGITVTGVCAVYEIFVVQKVCINFLIYYEHIYDLFCVPLCN